MVLGKEWPAMIPRSILGLMVAASAFGLAPAIARGAEPPKTTSRERHRLHQGRLHRAQARSGAAGRGRRAVSGGRRDSRRGLAAGEQGRCAADPAAVCTAGICRDLAAVSVLPQGRVSRAGSRREGRGALAQGKRQEIQGRSRPDRRDRLFGGGPPGADAGPDGPCRRSGGRRLRRRTG